MEIEFWGVRGSVPTPGTAQFSTTRFGGNTTCVAVSAPGVRVILDGGSGLRPLGLALGADAPLQAAIFFSHYHWDHIQGFPFFLPAFTPGNSFALYGPLFEHNEPGMLERLLKAQQQSFNFPVQLADMAAVLDFRDVRAGQRLEFAGTHSRIAVTAQALNHPGGCFGYRIEELRAGAPAVFAYATDHEHGADINANVQALARDADILFYDAQYTPAEYAGANGCARAGWGHSTYAAGLREAQAARVKKLLLTHHDPIHDDWAIAKIENAARRAAEGTGVEVWAAREGMKVVI